MCVSDEFFPAVLGMRQRWLAGVGGIGVGFGVPFALSIVLLATSGDPLFVILPLPFLVWAGLYRNRQAAQTLFFGRVTTEFAQVLASTAFDAD